MNPSIPMGEPLRSDRSPSDEPEPVERPDDAAAAKAAREEAMRELLAMPDTPPVARAPKVTAPESPVVAPLPGALSPAADAHDAFGTEEASVPVVPSARRAATGTLTLLEAGLGLLAIVLAGVLVFLAGREWNARARAARCAEELLELASAFERYRREEGKWPAAATARGAIPAGMERLLAGDTWTRPTPVGGHYAWVRPARKNPATLAITAFVPDAPLSLSHEQLRRIDALLDDGDLATGRFRTGFNGWPVFFLKGD